MTRAAAATEAHVGLRRVPAVLARRRDQQEEDDGDHQDEKEPGKAEEDELRHASTSPRKQVPRAPPCAAPCVPRAGHRIIRAAGAILHSKVKRRAAGITM